MAQDLLLPDDVTLGARVVGAIARLGAPRLSVAFWFRNRGVWTFAVATPDVDEAPTQDAHAAIDAAIATLGGVDAFVGLGDAILALSPADQPAPTARSALDAPPKAVIDGVGFNMTLGDIAVYDHRACV